MDIRAREHNALWTMANELSKKYDNDPDGMFRIDALIDFAERAFRVGFESGREHERVFGLTTAAPKSVR